MKNKIKKKSKRKNIKKNIKTTDFGELINKEITTTTEKNVYGIRDCCEIVVEFIGGQSFYPYPCLTATYYYPEDRIAISGIIASVVDCNYKDNIMDEKVFIDCEDEQLKLDIASAILKKHPELNFTTQKNTSGCNWGINVFVSNTRLM